LLYIIADDLTGATDTGVQLSKQGYETTVYLGNIPENNNCNNDKKKHVRVVDCESRELPPHKAKLKIKEILNSIHFTKNDIVYKKVDSTLRGNIMIEIEETMKITEKDLCIFTPAYPENKRVVAGGYLLINNVLLEESDYIDKNIGKYGGESYIPKLLNLNANIPIDLIDIKEIIKGPENLKTQIDKLKKDQKQLILFDATNNTHLENIIKSTNTIKESVLYAGSAGLANHLSKLDMKNEAKKEFEIKKTRDPFLMVIGSRRNIIDTQIKYLNEKVEVEEVKIDIKEMYHNKKEYMENYIDKVRSYINKNNHVIIRPILKSGEEIQGLDYEETKTEVRNLLGEITSNIIKAMEINKILLSGGDTAIGVCKFLKIDKLKILKEILPGIPLSEVSNSKLQIVTKAGGFGDEKSLYKIIKKMKNQLQISQPSSKHIHSGS